MRFCKIGKNGMDRIYDAMRENFASDELRDRESTICLVDDDRYGVYRIYDGDEDVGFVTIWTPGDFAFVEHFAIYEEFRNKGAGGRAIDEVCKKYGKVILEVEKPVDEIKKRRIAFYERHGFVVNPQPYVQPAYRRDSKRVHMLLMSYPRALSDFDRIIALLYDAVYRVKYDGSPDNGA